MASIAWHDDASTQEISGCNFAGGLAVCGAAQNVRQKLKRQASNGTQYHSAQLRDQEFSALYFHTSDQWLQFAKTCHDPELVYVLINQFYRLYERYMLVQAPGDADRIVDHWQPYFNSPGTGGSLNISFCRALKLFYAIRAHIRFDLAEAIVLAVDQHNQKNTRKTDLEAFRTIMFGPEPDRIFLTACLNFLETASLGETSRTVLTVLAKRFSWIWLRVFQSARRAAWNDAVRSIRHNQPICRTMNPSQREIAS